MILALKDLQLPLPVPQDFIVLVEIELLARSAHTAQPTAPLRQPVYQAIIVLLLAFVLPLVVVLLVNIARLVLPLLCRAQLDKLRLIFPVNVLIVLLVIILLLLPFDAFPVLRATLQSFEPVHDRVRPAPVVRFALPVRVY